jgi:hypothetical protein
MARFLPPTRPKRSPTINEDPMAKEPFDGFDEMTDAQVRARIAKELNKALAGYHELIKAALERAAESGETHAELIPDLQEELATIDEHADEGTQRWGKLPDF